MRQRSRLIIVLLATVYWVAGCTPVPNDDPKPTPTVTVAPSPSPSPTDTEPVDDVPEPAPLPLPEYPSDLTLEDTAENAVRAADYFVEVVNYTQSTGDKAPLQWHANDTCRTCANLLEELESLYADGGYIVGNSLTYSDTSTSRTDDGLAWIVRGVMRSEDGSQVSGDGTTKQLRGQSAEHYRVGVQAIEDRWIILEMAFGKAP